MLSSEKAKELITLGRLATLSVLRKSCLDVPIKFKEEFSVKKGVFVTLLTFPKNELRGCVGIPYPVYPLWEAVIHSSVKAAFKDSRFPPLSDKEIDKVIWELSVLTEPKELDKRTLPGSVRVGVDGLIVERGSAKGLLLPQVPLRYGWSAEEFLKFTCRKAGLKDDCWRDEATKVYSFQSDIFEEVEPWGKVKKVEFQMCR